MRRLRALLWLLGLCALSACGSGGGAQMGDYVGGNAPVECAPFARELTGVQLRGDAEDWWQEAAGRYQRVATPAVGSILVLARSRPIARRARGGGHPGAVGAPGAGDAGQLGASPHHRGPAGDRCVARQRLERGAAVVAAVGADGDCGVCSARLHPAVSAPGLARPVDRRDTAGGAAGGRTSSTRSAGAGALEYGMIRQRGQLLHLHSHATYCPRQLPQISTLPKPRNLAKIGHRTPIG